MINPFKKTLSLGWLFKSSIHPSTPNEYSYQLSKTYFNREEGHRDEMADPAPLTPSEIQLVQVLTIFQVSTRFITAHIAPDRMPSVYSAAERNRYHAQLTISTQQVRDQLESAPVTGESPQQFVARLINSLPAGRLDTLIEQSLRSDEAHSHGAMASVRISRYKNDKARLDHWRRSDRYRELQDPVANEDPPPPATKWYDPARDARRREYQLKSMIEHKYSYALSVVNGWWTSAAANASPIVAGASTMSDATAPAQLPTTVAGNARSLSAPTSSAVAEGTDPNSTTPASSGSTKQNT